MKKVGMTLMTILVSDVKCAKCGADLTASTDINDGNIVVEADPCDICLEEARDDGRNSNG